MPRNMRSRASPLNLTSLAAMASIPWLSGLLRGDDVFEHAHDVGFFHDDQLFAVELDLAARPFAEQHAVACPDIHRLKPAILAARAGTGRDHLAFHRLLLRGVGDDDPAHRLFLRRDAPNQHAIVQWAKFHEYPPRTLTNSGISTLWQRVLLR